MITTNKKTSFRRGILSLFFGAISVFALITPSGTAYAQTGTQPAPAPATQQLNGLTNDPENCAVEKIGWIVCPLLESISKAADKTYEILSNNFLQIEPELLTATPLNGNGTITAWEGARNLANVAFIIAFLLLIYSQITGAGLTNYGIKRMLPRLIIAAIAVNISYYICQSIVDLSNIMGFEIKSALSNIANSLGPQVMSADTQGVNTQTSGGTFGTLSLITFEVLKFGALIWIFTGLLTTIGAFVLITVISIIAILLLRKALVVMLVVISPLAFVAYLLPNTEKLFSKWLNMFWQLLMVFPIVALLFGGGQLASTIVLISSASAKAAQQTNQQTTTCSRAKGAEAPKVPEQNTGYTIPCEGAIDFGNGVEAGWMAGLTAAGIAIAPLLFVWSVLKGALGAAGAIGGKIAGAIDGASKNKRAGLMKKYGEDKERKRQEREIRALGGGFMGNAINVATLGSARRNARRRARIDRTKARHNEAYLDHVAGASYREVNGVPEATRFGRQLAGGIGPLGLGAGAQEQQRAISDAIRAQREIQAKNVQAAEMTVDGLNQTQLMGLAGFGHDAAGNVVLNNRSVDRNDPRLAAAIDRLAKIADKGNLAHVVDHYATGGPTLASRQLGKALDSEGYLRNEDLDNIRNGRFAGGLANAARTNIEQGIYSPEKLANASRSELTFANNVSVGSAQARASLQNAATEANGIDALRGKLSRNRGLVNDMEAGTFYTR